jgi:hypothetical protein
MNHKFSAGQVVYYASHFPNSAARGPYKIVRRLPIESDNRLWYRVKSAAESFERTAEEHQLMHAD